MNSPAIRTVFALDSDGTVIGAYAVDPDNPQLPGVEHARLVDTPDSPQPTGRMVSVPQDMNSPEGPTKEIPELQWPSAGWSYYDDLGFLPPPPKQD